MTSLAQHAISTINNAVIGRVNSTPCINTHLTLKATGCLSTIRSVATQFSTHNEFEMLIVLLSGESVEATIFSSTNVVGHTNEAQLRDCAKRIIATPPDERIADYIKLHADFYAMLERTIAKFGDGRLGFDIHTFIEMMPQQIQKIINSTYPKTTH